MNETIGIADAATDEPRAGAYTTNDGTKFQPMPPRITDLQCPARETPLRQSSSTPLRTYDGNVRG